MRVSIEKSVIALKTTKSLSGLLTSWGPEEAGWGVETTPLCFPRGGAQGNLPGKRGGGQGETLTHWPCPRLCRLCAGQACLSSDPLPPFLVLTLQPASDNDDDDAPAASRSPFSLFSCLGFSALSLSHSCPPQACRPLFLIPLGPRLGQRALLRSRCLCSQTAGPWPAREPLRCYCSSPSVLQ